MDAFSKESQLKLMQCHDRIEQIKHQVTENQGKSREYETEKASLVAKTNETKVMSNELINNALEKIQMFQKNEAFAKNIVTNWRFKNFLRIESIKLFKFLKKVLAKMQTISSYEELSNQKVVDGLAKLKKSLEMFKKYDKAQR